MTHKALAEILTKYADGRQSGARVEMPPGVDLTLFSSLGEDGLQIDRVRTVELEGEYCLAATGKGERFALLYEDVRAVRFVPATPPQR